LREAGHEVTRFAETIDILERIQALDPDVIVIDLGSPTRDALEQMFQMSRVVKRPIAMFVDRTDAMTTNAAIESGVSAYVVDGLRKERVRPIVEMAISRFNAFARLKAELEEAKSQLEDRKTIDRAKAILMNARKIDEQSAYALMRRAAMNENKRIVDIARSIMTAAELLR
jgi:response regulator NasT